MKQHKLRYANNGGVWTLWVINPATGKDICVLHSDSKSSVTQMAEAKLGVSFDAPVAPDPVAEKPKGKVLASTEPKTAKVLATPTAEEPEPKKPDPPKDKAKK